MHCWHRNKGHGKIARDGSYELFVHEFSDLLCGCLEDQKQLQASQKLASAIAFQQGIGKLERIWNDQGSIARAPSQSQTKSGEGLVLQFLPVVTCVGSIFVQIMTQSTS
jgi:hypothetical protein